LLMMTAHGKLQRIRASDISIVGRNTQGVRVMSLDDDDTLVAAKRVPQEENEGKPDAQFVTPGLTAPNATPPESPDENEPQE
jgi:DNA gyrase subunit A